MAKFPAIHFYPGDWLRDSISGCSLSAQGLWLRMMFLMHDSDRYGYLSSNGTIIPSESIARRCGCDTLAQYESLLTELTNAGVPERTNEGVIFSRRMVRDDKKRKDGIRFGKRGGNPTLKGGVKGIREDDNEDESLQKRGKGSGKGRAETMEEIVAYCAERGLPRSDGVHLWEKWEQNGWKNGGEKIKDWKGVIRSHSAAGYLPSQKGFSQTSFGHKMEPQPKVLSGPAQFEGAV